MTTVAIPTPRHLLALALVVASCAQPAAAPRAPAAPPAALRAEPAAASPAAPPEPASAEAVPEIAIQEAPAPATPLRYAITADCPLTYDLRFGQRTEMAPAGLVSGYDTLGQIEARADTRPGRMKMHFLWTRRDGVSGAGTAKGTRVEENQPEIMLVTDGTSFKEAPQTPMPARSVDIDRVSQAFPQLVRGAPAIGSEAIWKVPPGPTGGSVPVFGQRTTTDIPRIDVATLKIARWVKIGGDLACQIEGTWSKESSADQRVEGQRIHRRTMVQGAARFLVLSSGRLLSSEIQQSFDALTIVQSDAAPTPENGTLGESHETVSSELRLVKACNGATLPTLHAPPTASERAILAYARLRDMVNKGDRGAVAAVLAPALVARTGKDAVVDALIEYQKRFGAVALGFWGPPSATPAGSGDRFTFPVPGVVSLGGSGKNGTRVDVTLTIERKGDDFWIRSVLVAPTGMPGELLEISEKRIFVAEPSVLLKLSPEKR